jgi:hypothetical protein
MWKVKPSHSVQPVHSIHMQSTHCLQRKVPWRQSAHSNESTLWPVNLPTGRNPRNPSMAGHQYIQSQYELITKTFNIDALSQRKIRAFLRLQRLKMKYLLRASDWWTGVQVGQRWWVSSSCHTHTKIIHLSHDARGRSLSSVIGLGPKKKRDQRQEVVWKFATYIILGHWFLNCSWVWPYTFVSVRSSKHSNPQQVTITVSVFA